ncbi:MAG: carbohydrate ABC transporter permease [Bacillota bacterium]|nr:carbohydrate ABC transporter permease [Bacillota bacterium]
MGRRFREQALVRLGIGAVLLMCLFPFLVMLSVSLKPPGDETTYPPTLIPRNVTLRHYGDLFNPRLFPFTMYFKNSLVIACSSAAVALAVAIPGAYAFARLRFPGRGLVQRGILFIYMFSGILLVVPYFRMIVGFQETTGIQLIDTRTVLILTYLAFTLPVSLYMLANYFRTIPAEIEEAALIDGCTRADAIWRVIVPLSAPALVAVYIYAFMIAWNEYLFALVFLISPENLTLPRGLSELFNTEHYIWGRMMAASLLTAVPVVVLFLLLEKFMTAGLTFGAVKE